MKPPIPFPKRTFHRPPHGRIERESPSDQLKDIQQEARMVLPGIQALFGFQLIVVFNPGFKAAITAFEQRVHLAALLMSALAILLVIAPVAYHRQAQPGLISDRLVKLGSRCLGVALFPLITAIALDIYVVARTVTGALSLSVALASAMFTGFLWAWYIFPLSRKLRDLRQSRQS